MNNLEKILNSNDINIHKKELLELSNKYTKLEKRLNKIIKQSDKEQTRVLNLTEELNDQKNYLDEVINSQKDIVISTTGFKLLSLNKSFLQFYNVNNKDEFLKLMENVYVIHLLTMKILNISKRKWVMNYG